MERKEVDINELSPMMKEYMKTKEKYENVLLFYRLGDFYELFFEDAITASHELELTLTGKNAGLAERVPMCGVPHHAVNIYLDKLIEKGYKVAIAEQMEDPKTAKGIVKREVTQIVSKGTRTNTDVLNEKDYNYIAYLSDYKFYYVLSYADLLSGKICVTNISKNKSKLVSFLVNLNIKELVISYEFDKEIKNELENKYNIYISLSDEEDTSLYETLIKELENKEQKETVRKLLTYITKNLQTTLSHFNYVEVINNNSYLELDKEAVKNLELVETIREKERTYSLLWVLDKTKTAMGSRLLKEFILRPLIDKNEIIKRQDLVLKFNEEFLLKSELKEYLYEIYDLERLTGKVVCSNLNGRDLLQLNSSLKMIPLINKILEKLNLDQLKEFNELTELLDASINLDAPVTIKEGGVIKDGYHEYLDELRSIRRNGKDFISRFESDERERTGIKTLKVGYNKVFGYYIEVSKGSIKDVKEEFGYVRKQTISNSERYITPLLKEKEDLIFNAEDKINKLEYEIFNEIKIEVSKYLKDIQEVGRNIAFYDVMQSFSTVSEENNYVRSNISNERNININEARHPVVEKVIKNEYIKNDIVMDEKTDLLIITGPNMSGKSTYMRTFAMLVIMNQIGCFVPAKNATLPIFDKIFTRIGASDDLVGGESTFMVEMKESANALKNATKDSLIIFDELGRGTSTYDGMSLAGAIIDYIVNNIKCKTMFSTHYHELTNMFDFIDNIKNVHVEVLEENGEVKFLHKIKEGAVDKSYGINVAKLASLPVYVINKAYKILDELENENKEKKPKQLEMNLEIKEQDELREFIKTLNPLEMTPMDAINVIYEIVNKAKEKYWINYLKFFQYF